MSQGRRKTEQGVVGVAPPNSNKSALVFAGGREEKFVEVRFLEHVVCAISDLNTTATRCCHVETKHLSG